VRDDQSRIDVVVPVRRRAAIVDRVLRSFSRGTILPGAVLLVTNELDRRDVNSYGLDVRLVRFESDLYPIGFNDAALRRNVGIWAASAPYVLTFDDDQIAPPPLIESAGAALVNTPVCWGHHRFIDFDAFTFEEVIALPADAGRPRETPPNAWHSWRSAYGGLFAADRGRLQHAGGFDMVFSGRHSGEDQDLGRRLAATVHGGASIYVHEPPFAWHAEKPTAWEECRYSNLCRGDHSLAVTTISGATAHACSRCPFYLVSRVESTEPHARIPFDVSKVRTTVTQISRSMRSGDFATAFPFVQADALERIAAELSGTYDEYVGRFSSPDMAISLNTAALLAALCEGLNVHRALDVGAGFASVVLRASSARRGGSVWTVDDDQDMLDRVGQFVLSRALPEGRFTLWPEVLAAEPATFDFVFYDLGSMTSRAHRLPDVLNRLADNGVLVLDDMHKEEYAPAVERVLGGDRWQYLDPRPLSVDRYGRFCGVVVRA